MTDERTLVQPVEAIALRNGPSMRKIDPPVTPGAFKLEGEGSDQFLWYCCPCGCGSVSALSVYQGRRPSTDHAMWQWDGNRERPTLEPSIHHRIGTGRGKDGEVTWGTHWHGYLTRGYWRQPDQKVPG